MADIDARIKMQFRMRLRLGHFDPIGPLDFITEKEAVCTDFAIATSMAGAVQSCALLKNANAGGKKALPLDPTTVGTVAVMGPLAEYSEATTGYYGPHDCCGAHEKKGYWTLVDAVKKYATKPVVTAAGVPNAISTNMSGIPAAVALAKTVDTVVLAVGTDLDWAAEGHDAKSISFTHAQTVLISEVAAAAKKKIVVVLFTATPLDISALLANDKVGAVLHVGQPSVTVLAVAELIYGKVSPAGRTVQTFYESAYQDEISIFDFGMRPGVSSFVRPDCTSPNGTGCPLGTNPGRTHRFVRLPVNYLERALLAP